MLLSSWVGMEKKLLNGNDHNNLQIQSAILSSKYSYIFSIIGTISPQLFYYMIKVFQDSTLNYFFNVYTMEKSYNADHIRCLLSHCLDKLYAKPNMNFIVQKLLNIFQAKKPHNANVFWTTYFKKFINFRHSGKTELKLYQFFCFECNTHYYNNDIFTYAIQKKCFKIASLHMQNMKNSLNRKFVDYCCKNIDGHQYISQYFKFSNNISNPDLECILNDIYYIMEHANTMTHQDIISTLVSLIQTNSHLKQSLHM